MRDEREFINLPQPTELDEDEISKENDEIWKAIIKRIKSMVGKQKKSK